jgi:hypothetical protein
VNLSLKRSIISSLLILFLAFIFTAFAQENGGVGTVPISPAPYRVGERLTYNVSFSNFPSAAHVEIQVVSRGVYFGRDAFQLHAHVETTGVINVALFSLNNDYTTYVDAASGFPFRVQQVVRAATKPTDTFHDFNQSAGTLARSKQRAIVGTYDLLAGFYRARALPLTEGSTYTFLVRTEAAEYTAELKIVGRESVRTNVGTFNSIVGQIRVGNNSPIKDLKIYFTDDELHVPVLMSARVSTGDLRAELAASDFVKPPAAKASPTPPVAVAVPTSTPALSQPTYNSAGSEEWPFSVGEQLNYQVFIANSNAPMGSATFQVRGHSRYFDRDGLFLTVKAATTGLAARLFVASDQIDSYLDPKALLPYRTILNLIEGKRRINQTMIVNQDYGTATTAQGEKIEIPVGTHDYLSFFYAFRTFNLNPPRRNAISILVENKPKTLFITSLQREAIQLGEQKIAAIALSLTTDDLQSDRYQLRIWVSDDKRRLPLRITAVTEIGPLRADLAILPTPRH